MLLGWTIAFLIIALIAAVVGFTDVAHTSIGIARVIFTIFVILFLIGLALELFHKATH